MKVLVTGGNKGIGYAIIERLLKDKRVQSIYFTSRSKENAAAALNDFAAINANQVDVQSLPLDLLEQTSKDHFIDTLIQNQLEFDAVVHNAGVLFPGNLINEKIVDVTLQTNLLGPMELTRKMVQSCRLKPKARIIFVSSTLGNLSRFKKHKQMYANLLDFENPSFTTADLSQCIEQYRAEIFNPKFAGQWPTSAYAVSKLFLTMFAEVVTHDPSYKDFRSYACCPGWCKTDLTKGSGATKTAYEGAQTPTYLLFEDLPEELNGKFFFDQKPLNIKE